MTTSVETPTEERVSPPPPAKAVHKNALTSLMEQKTELVVDGVVDAQSTPFLTKIVDATTNPSIINDLIKHVMSKTEEDGSYSKELREGILSCIEEAKKAEDREAGVKDALDKMLVKVAKEIQGKIKGVVSLEVDPTGAEDCNATVENARKLIKLCKEEEVDTERIAIKIPATFAGTEAADILSKEDKLKINLTLVFSVAQAIRGALTNCFVVSAFVGRVTDFYAADPENKKKEGALDFGDEDPGVYLVKYIYTHLHRLNKAHPHNTVVMAASFRKKEQVTDLSGCDKITVPPKILLELLDTPATKETEPILTSEKAIENTYKFVLSEFDENPDALNTKEGFTKAMEADVMAQTLLTQGIAKFVAAYEDTIKFITTTAA